MKGEIFVLVVFCFLLACSFKLTAKERRGAELLITKTDGQEIRGALIAVKQTSLLLLDPQSGADESTGMEEITAIKITKKSKALLGGGIGLALGVAPGLIGAAGTQSEIRTWREIEEVSWTTMIVAGGVIGAIAGAGIGALLGKDETIKLSRDPERTKAVLEKLRSQARIKNYQ